MGSEQHYGNSQSQAVNDLNLNFICLPRLNTTIKKASVFPPMDYRADLHGFPSGVTLSFHSPKTLCARPVMDFQLVPLFPTSRPV